MTDYSIDCRYEIVLHNCEWHVTSETAFPGAVYGPYEVKKNAELMCKLLNDFWAAPNYNDHTERELSSLLKEFLDIKKERGGKV